MKKIYTEEEKANRKVALAKYRNTAKGKATTTKCNKEWVEANLDYTKKCRRNTSLWFVYVIRNYDNLNNDYCGATRHLYDRMHNHRSLGKLNTESYKVLEKFSTKSEALGFELLMHKAGYHGNKTITNLKIKQYGTI